ncbi:ANTAR domain-containing protein [Friedmanniella luteola]|uniref:ANTAR domain-containing protein n=1 Tax=Friedmanniella luteola TaxID=546871 RepID=A0A1H1UJK7_9ACTN|nr:ANTAR domain-containing protein [Friedmanniella luteola]SDS72677.1 ANTAR domain-containing protein [Friedmanniella luteola]
MTQPDLPPPAPEAAPGPVPARPTAAGPPGPAARHPVLERVADLARHVAPGVLAVSVTVLRDGRLHTLTTTGPGAALLDEQQRTRGGGPSLDALTGGRTVTLTPADGAWTPGFARVAEALGVQQVLAVSLPAPRAERLALTLYGTGAEPLSRPPVALVEALVHVAVDALRPTRPRPTTPAHRGLRAQAAVAQATGVVMAAHRCPADEALALLTAAASSQRRGLDEVATAVVADVSPG